MASTPEKLVRQNSSRFLALPPELRNHIYGSAFAADNNESVNLLSAKPPSKSLLLANKQTYREARNLYREGYKTFWETTNFFLDSQLPRPCPQTRLRNDDLAHITNMTLRTTAKAIDHNIYNIDRHAGRSNASGEPIFHRFHNCVWATQWLETNDVVHVLFVQAEERRFGFGRTMDRNILNKNTVVEALTETELSVVLGYVLW